MDLTLHVVGYGRLAAAILPRLRAAMPALGITVHSRTPARVQLEGVTATDAALEPGNDPVLILASADEGRVLAAMPRPPGADIPAARSSRRTWPTCARGSPPAPSPPVPCW